VLFLCGQEFPFDGDRSVAPGSRWPSTLRGPAKTGRGHASDP
jgi:hypothetical protein